MKNLLLIVLAVAQLCICSSVGGQESLALTIYNNGQAMVKDTRRITFDKGQSNVYFNDVASTIQPQTVMFTPYNQSGNVTIFEQNFQNNLASKYSILKNYLDKQVSIDVNQGNTVKTIVGKLLSYRDGFILQIPGGVGIYDSVSGVRVNELPEGLLTYPTLVWVAFSLNAMTTPCEVAYRAGQISWKADYLMKLNDNEDKADFAGWVTIENNSGKKYQNTTIKLIAGDVNNVYYPSYASGAAGLGGAGGFGAYRPSFQQKTFSDYHMYTLSRPVNLNDSSSKQILFIPRASNVSVSKTYNYDVPTGGDTNNNIKFQSTYKFLNSKGNNLGVPLPAGTIRAFKTDDADGSLEFIGESSIGHTPRDENVSITTGSAFDMVGKMTSLNKTTFDNGGYNAKVQLNVTNRGDKVAPVSLKLSNWRGDNNIISYDSNYAGPKWSRVSANQYQIKTNVPINQTRVIVWNENYRP